ncbi:MAG: hypothetical protein CMH40_07410 [Micrococcales bacterium]|nr:hypothetical protein [Micrococcales bacterium]
MAHDDQGTYGGFMRRTAIALAVVSALAIGACSSASIDEDAALACGWNEDGEPVVSALEASPDQRAEYAERARIRLEAARRVFAADNRFAPLVEALSETAAFAATLETLSAEEIAAVPNDEWDFAKYTQAVARDQCAQLARVVDGGREAL